MICSPEMFVDTYKTAKCHNQEDCTQSIFSPLQKLQITVFKFVALRVSGLVAQTKERFDRKKKLQIL
jgi:hypothetical protein